MIVKLTNWGICAPDDAVDVSRLEAVGEHGGEGEAGGTQQQERRALSTLQHLQQNSQIKQKMVSSFF
jgi:hypothetical protein